MIGGALNFFKRKPSFKELTGDFFGLACGEVKGLERDEGPGTKVSVLVALDGRTLPAELLKVSEDEPSDKDLGTSSF